MTINRKDTLIVSSPDTIPSKLIGMYTKVKQQPTSSLVKVYSDVPADTNIKSLHKFIIVKTEKHSEKKNGGTRKERKFR